MNKKQLIEGEKIVTQAKINATCSYSSFLKKYPNKITFSTNDWDFFSTVLSSFIAVQFLAPKSDDETFNKVYERVTEDLERLYPTNGNRALVDCENYFEQALGGNFKPDELILASGSWIWRNLTRKELEVSDREVIYSIGVLTSNSFISYWD